MTGALQLPPPSPAAHSADSMRGVKREPHPAAPDRTAATAAAAVAASAAAADGGSGRTRARDAAAVAAAAAVRSMAEARHRREGCRGS